MYALILAMYILSAYLKLNYWQQKESLLFHQPYTSSTETTNHSLCFKEPVTNSCEFHT